MFVNFTHESSTKVLFGKDQILNLGKEIKEFANSVLVVYGGGSIKRNGVYDSAIKQLNENGIAYKELSGVDPNPRVDSVREGIKLCKENKLEGVLALGGGSTIDCSKAIAVGSKYDGDVWDFFSNKLAPKAALPIFAVGTMAATGSETDIAAVITNLETKEKLNFGSPNKYSLPKVSVLDPTYLFSVPTKQTANGVADMMSHTFENYFNKNRSSMVSDGFAETLLKTLIKYGPIALKEPENYDARANLFWVSSLAINGLIASGKPVGWSVHGIEHTVSAYYDIAHGAGLAILTPIWMEYVLEKDEETLDNFVDYGVNVWGIDVSKEKKEIAKEAINGCSVVSAPLKTTLIIF